MKINIAATSHRSHIQLFWSGSEIQVALGCHTLLILENSYFLFVGCMNRSVYLHLNNFRAVQSKLRLCYMERADGVNLVGRNKVEKRQITASKARQVLGPVQMRK